MVKMNTNKGQKVWAKLKYSSYWPAEVRINIVIFRHNYLHNKILFFLRLLKCLRKFQKYHEIEFWMIRWGVFNGLFCVWWSFFYWLYRFCIFQQLQYQEAIANRKLKRWRFMYINFSIIINFIYLFMILSSTLLNTMTSRIPHMLWNLKSKF